MAGTQIRAGYAFKITSWLSWWPRAGGEFLFSHETFKGEADISLEAIVGGITLLPKTTIKRELDTAMNYVGVWFMADAPFVFSPAPGWAITLAPTIDVPLLGKVTAEVNGVQVPVSGAHTARNNKVLNVGAFLGAVGYW